MTATAASRRPAFGRSALSGAAALGFAIAGGSAADAASFDCKAASAKKCPEKAICASTDISSLDDQVSKLYGKWRGALRTQDGMEAARDEQSGVDAFGFELKTGKSYISGTAQVGARMGQFQLDTTDCDDITTVSSGTA